MSDRDITVPAPTLSDPVLAPGSPRSSPAKYKTLYDYWGIGYILSPAVTISVVLYYALEVNGTNPAHCPVPVLAGRSRW